MKGCILALILFPTYAFTQELNDKLSPADSLRSVEEVAYYTKVISASPKQAVPYHLRAQAEILLKNFNDALADLNTALSLNNKYYEAYTDRGRIKAQHLNYEGAIKDYAQSLMIEPTGRAYLNKGIAESNLDMLDIALTDINQAIMLNSNNGNYFYLRALLKQKMGDTEGAMQYVEQAIKMKTSDANFYLLKATLDEKLNHHKEVINDHDNVFARTNADAIGYYNRGNAKAATKDLNGAIRDFTAAIKLDSVFAEAYASRGVVKLK